MAFDAELAALRIVSDAAMPLTATIATKQIASDGMGGAVETWSTTVTTACRVVRRRVNEVGADAARRVIFYVELAVPVSVSLSVGQRVIVDGHTYYITSVQPNGWEVAHRAVLGDSQ